MEEHHPELDKLCLTHLRPPFILEKGLVRFFKDVGLTVSQVDQKKEFNVNDSSFHQRGGVKKLTFTVTSKKPGAENLFGCIFSAGKLLIENSPKAGGRRESKAAEKWSDVSINKRIFFAGLTFKYFSSISEVENGDRKQTSSWMKTNALEAIFKVLYSSLEYCQADKRSSEIINLKLETLRAFSTFLHERGFLFQKHFQGLASLFNCQIRSLMKKEIKVSRWEAAISSRLAIDCAGSMCLRGGTKLDSPSLSLLFNSCFDVVKEPTILNFLLWLDRAKILKAALRTLQIILKEDKRVFSGDIKSLLEILMNHVLPDSTNHFKGSDERVALSFTEISSNSEFHLCSGSDADFHSDASKSKRILAVLESVRCFALQLLQTTIECNQSEAIIFWEVVLPKNDFLSDRSLISVLLNDPSSGVRSKAQESLSVLLEASQKFLEAAVYRDIGKSAFTSFSDKLGVILYQSSLGICQALLTEETKHGILALFRISEVVLSRCSHNKTGDTLVHLFSQVAIHKINLSSDPEIRSASWRIFRVLLEADIKEETMSHLIDSKMDGNSCSLRQLAWEVLGNCDLKEEERSEAAHFLIAIIKTNRESWTRCAQIAELHIHDESPLVRASLLKMMFEFGTFFQLHNELDSQIEFWTCIIDDYLGQSTADKDPQVRVTICNGLGAIPSDVFDHLNNRRRLFCITLLLGYVDDEDAAVRASSFRALGLFAAFESLAEDSQFICDALSLSINRIYDISLDVKARASWCLANLCDVLIPSELEKEIFFKAIEAGLASCESHDKLKWNGVRILGGLVRHATPDLLSAQSDWLENVASTIQANIRTGPLKVRWNACYAIKNMHNNPYFPPHPIPKWYDSLIIELLGALKNKNFKLKAASLSALAEINESASDILLESLQVVNSLVELLPTTKNRLNYQEISLFQPYEDQLLKTNMRLKSKSLKYA
ncbi:HEAT repeat-containing protein 6 [Entomophthora muscae]|uniref:HEAT repeat-containing protein 6 n=2 Tax=Entomophthora muscae TaxID=34485 RepID=A0ACC2TKW0_9FUNG|nr:HEAT repeat-containing protein 6 [Entomophthora muscae]